MIDVGHAIFTARSYLEAIFAPEGCRNVRLEEVVLSDDDRSWKITFSFERSTLGGTLWTREYKLVTVDAESGQARGITIRELV